MNGGEWKGSWMVIYEFGELHEADVAFSSV